MPGSDLIRRLYAPELFRAQGHALIDQLADYLERVTAGHAGGLPVLAPRQPAAVLADWPAVLLEDPPEGAEDFTAPAALDRLRELVARVLADSNHLHHPRYLGHQATPPLPLAALCELVSALLNNDMAIFDMGPSATAIERSSLRILAGRMGLAATADGVLTSGGSLGNLTALLTARNQAMASAGPDRARGPEQLAILASEQVHYSVSRAAQVMGLGVDGVVPVPADAEHRMEVSALPDALREAERRGRRAFCVVATAGTTATGAFDPLAPIADFCRQHGLWLHVDAAHGGAASFSSRYRSLLAGIELADSVVCDGHKLLLMPAPLTAVLFRRGDHSFASFAQDAVYLFGDEAHEGMWLDVGLRTLECTKQMLGLKLYICLSLYGARALDEHVTWTFDLTRRFAEILRATEDFDVPILPSANILCFRYRPPGVEGRDALQERILRALRVTGEFYVVKTKLAASVYLRVTISNPLTTEADLHALISAIRGASHGSAPG